MAGFSKYDTNHDGQLSRDEFAAAMGLPIEDPVVGALFEKFDQGIIEIFSRIEYIYACMYVSLFCMYAYLYACMHICMHACMHACPYGCQYIYICIAFCMLEPGTDKERVHEL